MAVEVTVRFAGSLLATTVVGPDDTFRIGTAPGVELALPGFTSFPIVDRGGVVRIPVGTQVVGGELVFGHVRVTIAPAAPVAPIPPPRADRRPLPYIASVLALHVGVWAAAMLLADPPAPRPIKEPPRLAHAIAKTPLPPPPPVRHARSASASRAGKPEDGKRAEGQYKEPMIETRESAIESARHAGIVGDAQVAEDLAKGIAALVGTVDIKKALDEVGPLYRGAGDGGDDEYANGFGGHAGNFDPTNRPEFASVKTGAYKTVATGRGAGADYDLGGAHAIDVHICEGGCTASGTIDRHDVTTWIAPHVDELRACFAGTAGAVTVTFTIAADGTVKRPAANGLADVAPCVAQVVSGISFPRTDGVTRVRYPIVFRT